LSYNCTSSTTHPCPTGLRPILEDPEVKPSSVVSWELPHDATPTISDRLVEVYSPRESLQVAHSSVSRFFRPAHPSPCHNFTVLIQQYFLRSIAVTTNIMIKEQSSRVEPVGMPGGHPPASPSALRPEDQTTSMSSTLHPHSTTVIFTIHLARRKRHESSHNVYY